MNALDNNKLGRVLTPLSWENFLSSILVNGEERVHRASEIPLIEVFADGKSMGLWLEVADKSEIPNDILRLAFVGSQLTYRTVKKRTVCVLELTLGAPALYRQFYHFAIATIERVLVERRSPIDAVLLELQGFAELFAETPLMGIGRQLGLLGELVVLERLIARSGQAALDAWIGPLHEPHDFRIGKREYEVKTTICAQRIHTINGPEQLVATKGCKLFLLSVLLGSAGQGEGYSLAAKVQKLLTRLQSMPERKQQFLLALEACGYRLADSTHYGRRFALRRSLAVVPVDANFPAITRPIIHAALGKSLGVRIEGLQYDVNVDGLESEEGSSKFPEEFCELESVPTKGHLIRRHRQT